MSDALFRLIGDGDRATGGAIPLPVAFTAVVNELLDYGTVSFSRLNRLVSDVLAYKEERIMAAAWRTWEQFTTDILTCLKEMNLLTENGYRSWELTEEFVPGHTFHIPGTTIGFTGRKKEDRDRRNQSEALYLAVKGSLLELQEQAMVVLQRSPLVHEVTQTRIVNAEKFLKDAVEDLERELGFAEPKPTRYQQRSNRKPHERHRRIRKGMTSFFRDEFWVKYAEPGVWYDIRDAADKFEELNPDQPSIDHGDLHGSMRKVAREMVDSGYLEMNRVMGNGAWKHVFRRPVPNPVPPGYGANASVVTWEGIKPDPKETSKRENLRKERAPISFVEESRDLKKNPGVWKVVYETDDRQLGANQAHRINTGRLKAFLPAGAFEAYSRTSDGVCEVHARYIGDQSISQGQTRALQS